MDWLNPLRLLRYSPEPNRGLETGPEDGEEDELDEAEDELDRVEENSSDYEDIDEETDNDDNETDNDDNDPAKEENPCDTNPRDVLPLD